jgi:hypothetical protein
VPDVVAAEFTSDETVIMSGSCVPNKSCRRYSYILYAFLTLSRTIPITAKNTTPRLHHFYHPVNVRCTTHIKRPLQHITRRLLAEPLIKSRTKIVLIKCPKSDLLCGRGAGAGLGVHALAPRLGQHAIHINTR